MQITSGKVGGALKVVVYGPEGIGKSTFASQFPAPVFIDTEGSTKFMDVSRTQAPSSWALLMEQVRYFATSAHQFKTVIIDTADWAEQLCVSKICAEKRISGIEDMGYGKGYVYLEEEFGKMLNLLSDVVASGIHVVLTAHAQMRKFEQPDEMGTYDRWELKLEKKVSALVKEWADIVLFANYKTTVVNVDNQGALKGKNKVQGGKRVMYATHHPCWDAKNRHGLPDDLPFEFAPIAHLFAPTATPAPEPPLAAPPAASAAPPRQESSTAAAADTARPAPVSVFSPPNVDTFPPRDNAISAQEQMQIQTTSSNKTLAALHDLMRANNVEEHEIRAVVAKKGYFPETMPVEKYPEDFIKGVLVGAWQQVFQMIIDTHPIPF